MKNFFDASREAIVSTAFTRDGRPYKVGEVFPHVALGVVPLDLKGLWMTSLIRFTDAPASRPAVTPAKGKKPDQATT